MGPRLLAVAAASALALGAGCGGDGDLPPFQIKLALDPDQGCASSACTGYGMSCGATLSVRIVDATDPSVILEEKCVVVPPADTLCSLGEAEVGTFTGLPRQNARIEVTVWPPPAGEEEATCPSDVYDLQRSGVPRLDLVPQPAFGRSVLFDLGAPDAEITVPLACTDARRIDSSECAARTTYVRADLDDLDTLVGITAEQGGKLAVFVGEPETGTDAGTGDTFRSFETATAHQLTFIPPGIMGFAPYFEAVVPGAFGGDVCVLVTDLDAAQATSAVQCTKVPAGAETLGLRAFLAAPATLDAVVAALGLDDFPADGMVVGRVVDHTGQPLAGVRITPSAGTVSYLSADLTGSGLTQTSASGFFVSQNAPYDTAWTASHLDGRTEDGTFQAGLVRGRASVLVIRMAAPAE